MIRVQRWRQQWQEAKQIRHDWDCAYVGHPFVIPASRNHPLLDCVTAFVDQQWYKCSDTVGGGSNDEKPTDAGTNEVVSMSVSLSLLPPPGIILCLTVSLTHTLISSSSPHPYSLGEPLASNSISKSRDHAHTTEVTFLCVPLYIAFLSVTARILYYYMIGNYVLQIIYTHDTK